MTALQNSEHFNTEESYWEDVAQIRNNFGTCEEFINNVQATLPYHNPNTPMEEVDEELEEYFYKGINDD